MKFSLVIGTLNRSEELLSCLKSIQEQLFKDYEVIIVDQSNGDSCRNVAEQFLDDRIKYFHVDFKGLSKARNYALQHSSGEYVCLMDDDAVYPPDFLKQVEAVLKKTSKQILSGIIISIDDCKTPFIDCGSLKDGQLLNVKEVTNYCPSAALTFPMSVFNDIGEFDERLGVGNEYAAGEETDFLLRAMDGGYMIQHCKVVKVYHPIKAIDYCDLTGVYKHAMGKGALVKIDFKTRKKCRLLNFALRNTLGMIVKWSTSDRAKREMYKTRLDGFVAGYKKFVV